MFFIIRVQIMSVEILVEPVMSVMTMVDSIRVEHWNNLEYKVVK